MNVGFIATRIQALVMRQRDDLLATYDRQSDATRFWAFVDLKGSTNYRILRGLREGYVRAETFFGLMHTVAEACGELRIVKELGDGALMECNSFRPLFECLLLADRVAWQLATTAGTDAQPFGLRAAIGFGPAKKLVRPSEDFVGSPLDQLARIAAVRSAHTNILLDEAAYGPSADILREYADFVKIEGPTMVPDELTKGMPRPVYYREAIVNREAEGGFDLHFEPWKEAFLSSRQI